MTHDTRWSDPRANSTAAPLHPTVLSAIGRTRADGLHFWGRMLGVDTGTAPDGTPALRAPDGADVATVATVVDISLGRSVRREVGDGFRLATTSLAIDHIAVAAGPVTCSSRCVWLHPGGHRALAEACAQDEAGALVATARAWFSVLPVPRGVEVVPMPWEREPRRQPLPQPTLNACDLTADELASAVVATAALRRRRDSGLPIAEELLGLTWTPTGDAVVGRATMGPHLGNRVGMLQGGAVYGVAALAAQRLAGPHHALAEGSLQYLRPGLGRRLGVTASVTRRGRTATFVETEVEVDGRRVATGLATFFSI